MRIFLSVSLILNIMITLVFANSIEGYSDKLKRDPFLPLLDAAGREKADSELVRSAEVNLPLNISLKGIIWSKTSPLVVINDKIFREGDLVFEGLILEKINPGSIILNNRGERIEIVVRKKEKKEVERNGETNSIQDPETAGYVNRRKASGKK